MRVWASITEIRRHYRCGFKESDHHGEVRRSEDLRIYLDTLDNLEHAYAVTVLKSQGSEFPAVVIPLLKVPPMLVYRNLLYTAITRAKRLVVIIGNPDILRRMIEDSNERERYSD